jgi:hypothetical protein
MMVRKIALSRFGPANLPAGAPLSDLRRVIVPIYLFHRYEVDAVAKTIGGVDFNYGVRGDGSPDPRPSDGAAQRRALTALLGTLDPSVLDLPDPLIDQLSVGRDGTPDKSYEIELFSDSRSPVFDLAAAARAASDITLGALLEPSRLARVADQGARDASGLGLTELLTRLVDTVLADSPATSSQRQLGRVVRARLVLKLGEVLEAKDASPTVIAETRAALDRLAHRLDELKAGDPADLAQARYLSGVILDRSRDELADLVRSDRAGGAAIPPGMPIGGGGGEDCWFCEPLGSSD